MKISTSKLKGLALAYAVALVEKNGITGVNSAGKLMAMPLEPFGPPVVFDPENDQAQGGTIIDRENISTLLPSAYKGKWWACIGDPSDDETMGLSGETRLRAAMRCHVEKHLGEEVEIPEDLLTKSWN